jgi:hypothetical protein
MIGLFLGFGLSGQETETWLWVGEAFWEKQWRRRDMGHTGNNFWKLRERDRRHGLFLSVFLREDSGQANMESSYRFFEIV